VLALWALFGLSWVCVGGSGCRFGSLGGLVLAFWALFALSWVCLGGSGSLFGGSWVRLGRHLVFVGVFWRFLWMSTGQFGAFCGCIWLDLAVSGWF